MPISKRGVLARVGVGVTALAAAGAVLAAPAAASTAAACDPSTLRLSLGDIKAGAGQRYAPLNITTTGAACTLSGAPADLAWLDATGRALPTSPRFAGGDTPVVHVGGAGKAKIQLHWSVVPTGSQEPFTPASLRLKLPGAAKPSTLAWTGGVVNGSIEYGPVNAG